MKAVSEKKKKKNNCSYSQIWSFFHQLFKAIIDVFCDNTPKSFLKSIPFLSIKKMIFNFLILTKFKQFLNETFLGIFIYFILLYLATVINGMCVWVFACVSTNVLSGWETKTERWTDLVKGSSSLEVADMGLKHEVSKSKSWTLKQYLYWNIKHIKKHVWIFTTLKDYRL